MDNTVTFRLEVRVGRTLARNALAGALVLLTAGELASESVTLSTYYPAPAGIYNSLMATQSSFLATKGGRVGIGITSPANLFDVNGNADVRGKLGVGMTTPANPLDVNGDADVRGRLAVGAPAPAASAALDVTSTTKGLLMPRMTQAQRNAIPAPAAGLEIYDTTSRAVEFWDGSSWVRASGGMSGCASKSVYAGWSHATISVYCGPGYYATGGGCTTGSPGDDNIINVRPLGNPPTGWQCYSNDNTTTVWVVCCK